jgi:hypothetical protein
MTAAKLLARDESRQIAANIAKLPELLGAQTSPTMSRGFLNKVEAKFIILPVFLPDPICCLVVPELCFGPG